MHCFSNTLLFSRGVTISYVSAVLVVSFDPVMYMVHEEDGQVILMLSVQGSAIITLSVNITTSPDDGTADGQLW